VNGHRKNRLPVALTAVVLTLAPAAAAGISDGRSPDTIDAALATTTQIADGRSPDTRDAALAAHSVASTPGDLRSPDTKDAAQLAHPTASTTVLRSGSQNFDWTDAGIGAAGGFAIALILGGVVLLARVGSKRKLAL